MTPENLCACAAATRFELWNGIPRLLFGQKYWGECSAEKMTQLLNRMDDIPWRQAITEIAPDEPVQQHLCSPIGPEFVHSMPWDEIKTVLEIGSGMGFMTWRLAARAEQVIAVEAVPERALFQRKRAIQEGFPNWHPIIADGASLPFPPETFDLIALNGVFEYLGLWGKGDPQQLQDRFLTEALRLLKPNGYLYLGIETRYALSALRGRRDLSGLAFTSLMPRWLADWYCRRRHVPVYGSDEPADGYRTYTHTPAQYVRMCKQAGFESVDVYGAYDSYNRQMAVYPLGDAKARRVTRSIVSPPATRKGQWLRWIADAGPWYKLIENEVVIFGRKRSKVGSLCWQGLPHQGPITQYSTGNKVFALCFSADKPVSVYIAPKNDYAKERLEREYDFLQSATQRHGQEAERWRLRWPKPLGTLNLHGRKLYHYEYANGTPLNHLLLAASFDAERFLRLLAQLMNDYIDLCLRLTAGLPARPPQESWYDLLKQLAGVRINDEAVARRIAETCAKLRQNPWPAHVIHGDLSLSNVVALPDGGIALIDWENISPVGLIAVDLMRLLYDTWDDTARLKPKVREALMTRARQTTRAALQRLGLGPENYDDVEILFLAHQIELGSPRYADNVQLLEAYQQRALALDQECLKVSRPQ